MRLRSAVESGSLAEITNIVLKYGHTLSTRAAALSGKCPPEVP